MTNYSIEVEESTESMLVIRDLGPWDYFKTITNAAEEVVAELTKYGALTDDRRLVYYDSEGEKSELLHRNGDFIGFAPFLEVQNDEDI